MTAEADQGGPFSSSATRLAPIAAILLAIVAQFGMRHRIAVVVPWLAPTFELVLVAILLLRHPVDRQRADRLRVVRFLLGGTLALSATASSVLLIADLIQGDPQLTLTRLLVDTAEVLFVSAVGFAVIYWQLDRGGPDGRQRRRAERLAFWFTQDGIREYSDEFDVWQPRFLDYMYVSTTNQVAFSPTDTMPLTRTAKMLMVWQSVVAIATLGIVLANAINLIPSPK
jgi:hypothetical protein